MPEEIIGGYMLLEQIGEGGMGEVYRGIDMMLEREVAIKFLRPEFGRRPEVVERFRKEAIVLGKLNHPNIATLYSFARHDDRFFMVMEFAHGKTLDRIIAAKKIGMPWKWALSLFCQALRAIVHAHGFGVVHRDLKPPNLILSEKGVLKVLDFGIARILGSSRLTLTGLAVGTLKYMSPEQVRGDEVDPRSDIYSLGILLYEMLAGTAPFGSLTEYDLMRAKVEESPPPLGQMVPGLPKAIEDVVGHALATNPERRIQTAADFLDGLEDLAPDTLFGFDGQVIAPPVSRNSSGQRRCMSAHELVRSVEQDGEGREPQLRGRRFQDQLVDRTLDGRTEILYESPNARERASSEVPQGADKGMSGRSAMQAPRLAAAGVAGTDRLAQVFPYISVAGDRASFETDAAAGMRQLGRADAEPARGAERNGRRRREEPSFVPSLVLLAWTRYRTVLMFLVGLAVAVPLLLLLDKAGLFAPRLIAPEDTQTRLLLDQTEQALAAGRLIDPDQDNALQYLRQVARRAPRHPRALVLTEEVARRTAGRGDTALQHGDVSRARLYLHSVLELSRVFPVDNAGVTRLAKAIDAEEQRLAQVEHERKAQEERDRRIASLMEQAREAAGAGHYVWPRETSVVAYAEPVLQLAPRHAEAFRLIAEAMGQSVAAGRAALKQGDFDQARIYRDEGLALAKKHHLPDSEITVFANDLSQGEQLTAELVRRQAEQVERAARVGALLEKARKALAEDRVSDPPGKNVVAYGREVLKLMPQQAEARELLRQAMDRIVADGEKSFQQGDLDRAQTLLAQGQTLVREAGFDAARLAGLSKSVAAETQRRAEAERKQAEAARLEEQRKAEEARARQAKIQALLGKAHEAMRAGRLDPSTPSSAVESVAEVLKLEPQQEEAQGMLAEVVASLLASAQEALSAGDVDRARRQHHIAVQIAAQYRVPNADLEPLAQQIAGAQRQRDEQLVVATVERSVALGREALERGKIDQAKAYRGDASVLAQQHHLSENAIEALTHDIAAAEQHQTEQAALAIRVEALLDQGRKALREGRILAPADDNAVVYGREVLRLAPEQAKARELLSQALDRIGADGRKSAQQGDLESARALQAQAQTLVREANLDGARLTRMDQAIEAEERRRAEIERKKAEQARLEEQRKAEEARAREARIQGLVDRARQALEAHRLDPSIRYNAVEYAAEILKLEPEHAEARRMMAEVVAGLAASVQSALSIGDLERARHQLQVATQVAGQYRVQNAELEPLARRISEAQKQQDALIERWKKDEAKAR